MPVQLADATGGQVHVNTGDLLGDREVLRRQLARPASVLNPFRRDVERGPEEGLRADVSGRRVYLRGKLAFYDLVVRTVAAEALGIAGGVQPALRRQVRIAEGWYRTVWNRANLAFLRADGHGVLLP